jgi:hypothetical protein
MIAPKIDFSDRDERLEFISERFKCQFPACGGCGSCNLPDGKPAIEVFADYIDGKVEFVTIASKLWEQM